MTSTQIPGFGGAVSAAQASVLSAANTTVSVAPGTSASDLQRLIDTAEAGTTIRLAAGNFTFDRTIKIDRDDIAVVGAGSDKTFISVPKTLGAEAFAVGEQHMSGSFTLARAAAEGATTITLTGSHGFAAGDYIYLARDSTEAFYDEIGDQTWRNTDVPLRTSIVQVGAVNGSTITLTSGLHFDFVPGETEVREIDLAENVRLGGFSVDYNMGEADPSDFANTLSAYDRNAVIEVEGTAGFELFDVTAHDVPSLGVNVALSRGMSADGIVITGAHNKGDGGNGYALQIRDVYDSSFINLSDRDMRHSVVFASWRSAVNNEVHVTSTDRDINFHGGRHHDNVVMVDSSIRDANSDIIGRTVFINTEGTHYGTVTDAGANEVRFGTVVGSRLADAVMGYDGGSWLDGRGGNDSLTGGNGNDLLVGGAGRDSLTGGAGDDIADYSGRRADFRITSVSGGVEVVDTRGDQSTDRVTGVEWLTFDDGAIRLSDLTAQALSAVDGVFRGAATYTGRAPLPDVDPLPDDEPLPDDGPLPDAGPPVLTGTSGKDVFDVTVAGTIVKGLGNWDVVRSTVDFVMADDVERLELLGSRAIDGIGGSTKSQIYGNDAANSLHGMDGKDKLRGEGGNDQLFGGEDKDELQGGEGDDLIDGGAGRDRLTGDEGADTFRFVAVADSARTKHDRIRDFEHGTDTIDLRQIDADSTRSGDQAFVWSAQSGNAGALWLQYGYVAGDINGDRLADFSVWVGNVALDAGDFML